MRNFDRYCAKFDILDHEELDKSVGKWLRQQWRAGAWKLTDWDYRQNRHVGGSTLSQLTVM